MTKCLIYSGHRRTYHLNKENHVQCLGDSQEVHFNDGDANMDFYNGITEWEHYRQNKVPETTPNQTVNQWHNNFMAFSKAPKGFDCYIRIRYDIKLSGAIDFNRYPLADDVVYIPVDGDFWEGVNDRFAFGNYEAIRKYYSVYLLHPLLFHMGKRFHTESYLKHALDHQGVRIVRLEVTADIVR